MVYGDSRLGRRCRTTAIAIAGLAGLTACSGTSSIATAEAEAQRQEIDQLKREVQELRRQYAELAATATTLEQTRGAGVAGATAMSRPTPPATTTVAALAAPPGYAELRGGQATSREEKEQRAAEVVGAETVASPDFASLLTPTGTLMVDPMLEYTLSTSDRLVYRGVEVVPGIQIGLVEASEAERSTLIGSLGGRLGLSPRWEAELRVPYVYRFERFEDRGPRPETDVIRIREIDGSDLGDVEFGLRYQINGGGGGWPFLIAGLKITSPTGTGPYDIDRDADGIAQGVATGSGAWSYEGTLSAIYPTDPAVLFGTIGYTYSPSYDVDRTFGTTRVGEVDIGDSINLSIGMGFAINNDLSFTLGYKHNYVFETESELDGGRVSTDRAQIGASMLAFSYRLSDRVSINTSLEFGVTEDAPDLRAFVRVPVSLQVW